MNTYVYACSDGSEAYTMSILLQHGFSDCDKFFPIIAKDYSENVIAQVLDMQNHLAATTHNIDESAGKALNLTPDELDRYLAKIHYENKDYNVVRNNVKNKVQFSRADITKDTGNIDPYSPSIVMCRNMWPYVDTDKYEAFAHALYEQLALNSIVVIGNFDCKGDREVRLIEPISKYLIKAGFKPSECEIGTHKNGTQLIFEKH